MRREPVAAPGADPAGAWIKEWHRLIPPPGVWWRKSAFDLARARRANRLRLWRWLTEPVVTLRIWLATGRLSPAHRARWNRHAETTAAADPLLSALDPHQRRAAACFEDRAMVTAGAGSGKTRTMVARAGYAARRLGTPTEAVAFITFTNKATEEIRQRTRERLPGLQVGTIHQLARRVLKLVDGHTVQLSPMAEDDGLRLRRIAGWIREEIVRDPGLAADIELRRNARAAAVKDGEPVEHHRIPPDGRQVKSHGEVVIGTLLYTAGVPFVYEASFPLPAGKAGSAAGADVPPEDLRGYRPDFYLPDNPAAPVTAEGGVWLEHYAHDRSGRAPAEFVGYEEARAWKRRLHESLSTRYVETSFGDLQCAWDGDGPGMAEVLVERLRASGVEIDDPERWTVEAAADVGDDPAAEPGPLTLEVDAWIGAVRRRPAGRPPPTKRADVGALRRIGGAVRRRYERELADTGTTDHDGTILEATDAARRRPDLLPWRHVIVDEYQDVNPGAGRLRPRPDGAEGPSARGQGRYLDRGRRRLAGDLRVSGRRCLPDSDDSRSGRGRADALRTDHARQRVPLRAGARRRLEGRRGDGSEGQRPTDPRPRAGAGRRGAAGIGHRGEAHAGPRGRARADGHADDGGCTGRLRVLDTSGAQGGNRGGGDRARHRARDGPPEHRRVGPAA